MRRSRWMWSLLCLPALIWAACGPGQIDAELYFQQLAESNNPVHGVDISHWTQNITDEQVACWRDQHAVRHVIAGTQVAAYTVQQLDTIVRQGGISVDAYVWIYWHRDVTAQVQSALAMVQDFPIGRMWLDVEEDPAGRSMRQLEAMIQEGLDACGGFPCGIYTGKGWWDSHMDGCTSFGDVPLWYSNYDHNPSLSTWSDQRFGAWEAPTGKQYTNTTRLCGATICHDHIYATYTPGEAGTPGAPEGLSPDRGQTVTDELVTLGCDPVEDAAGYEFEIGYRNGLVFQHYDNHASAARTYTFTPRYDRSTYRFRVRAMNEKGWGLWSAWAVFDVYRLDPGEQVEAPTGLEPDGQRFANGQGVTLRCMPVAGAGSYEFEVFRRSTGQHYYTFSSAVAQKTIYPANHDEVYQWRVRALSSAGWGMWSMWAEFAVGDAWMEENPPDDPPPDDPPPDDPPPDDPPAAADAPAGLGETCNDNASVTLHCDPASGALLYEFHIEFDNNGQYAHYFSYEISYPQQTFWPMYDDRGYRWQARVKTSAGWSGYSAWAYFDFPCSSDDPPPDDPPPDDPPPDDPPPAGAPAGLGQTCHDDDSVSMYCDPLSGATRYEFSIEYQPAGQYVSYWTYTGSAAERTFWPQSETRYRFRVRAETASGWSGYSAWAYFDFPCTQDDPPPDDPPPDDPPPDGDLPPAPSGLSPNGVPQSGPGVTLSCNAIASASSYAFEIEMLSGGSYGAYYTYTAGSASKTFYPAVDGTTYRFRVRASNAAGWGANSAWAYFDFR
ncbi:MAG: hypothetical protein JXR96_25445 [Deltaproteobacteria bacterium]|nr:hypothetical protein [Deltaproteobacteria bacterium]